jgi:hypothetical protein
MAQTTVTSLEVSLPEEIGSISELDLFVDIEQKVLIILSKAGHRIRIEIPQSQDTDCSPTAKFSRKKHKLTIHFKKRLVCNLENSKTNGDVETDDSEQSTANNSCKLGQASTPIQRVEHQVENEPLSCDCYTANMENIQQSTLRRKPETRTSGYQKSLVSLEK